MVEPHPHQVLDGNGEMYAPTVIKEELASKEIMEEKMKGEFYERLKNTIESKAATTI